MSFELSEVDRHFKLSTDVINSRYLKDKYELHIFDTGFFPYCWIEYGAVHEIGRGNECGCQNDHFSETYVSLWDGPNVQLGWLTRRTWDVQKGVGREREQEGGHWRRTPLKLCKHLTCRFNRPQKWKLLQWQTDSGLLQPLAQLFDAATSTEAYIVLYISLVGFNSAN